MPLAMKRRILGLGARFPRGSSAEAKQIQKKLKKTLTPAGRGVSNIRLQLWGAGMRPSHNDLGTFIFSGIGHLPGAALP
jgi:hypothetical protein